MWAASLLQLGDIGHPPPSSQLAPKSCFHVCHVVCFGGNIHLLENIRSWLLSIWLGYSIVTICNCMKQNINITPPTNTLWHTFKRFWLTKVILSFVWLSTKWHYFNFLMTHMSLNLSLIYKSIINTLLMQTPHPL